MSIPEGAAAQDPDQDAQQTEETVSFESKVNTVVSELKTDDEGKIQFPEDTPEEVQVAARAEMRRRGTQSAFAKEQQRVKALEVENEKLKGLVTSKVELSLSAEEQEQLDDLKFSDPEAWRQKVNDLETEAKKKTHDTLNTISQESNSSAELKRREQLLDAYNEEHPGATLTDDVIANDLPPRITSKLANGEATFEEFLAEASNFLNAAPKVGQEELDGPTNLGSVGGGVNPAESAIAEDATLSYNDEIY